MPDVRCDAGRTLGSTSSWWSWCRGLGGPDDDRAGRLEHRDVVEVVEGRVVGAGAGRAEPRRTGDVRAASPPLGARCSTRSSTSSNEKRSSSLGRSLVVERTESVLVVAQAAAYSSGSSHVVVRTVPARRRRGRERRPRVEVVVGGARLGQHRRHLARRLAVQCGNVDRARGDGRRRAAGVAGSVDAHVASGPNRHRAGTAARDGRLGWRRRSIAVARLVVGSRGDDLPSLHGLRGLLGADDPHALSGGRLTVFVGVVALCVVHGVASSRLGRTGRQAAQTSSSSCSLCGERLVDLAPRGRG